MSILTLLRSLNLDYCEKTTFTKKAPILHRFTSYMVHVQKLRLLEGNQQGESRNSMEKLATYYLTVVQPDVCSC